MNKIVVVNLKMNFNLEENIIYSKHIEKIIDDKDEVIICPSYPFLNFYNNGNYVLGAQNVSEYNKGPFTGEVSARDLASLDVEYCLVGHPDRRNNFKENDGAIVNKINSLIDNSIIPILCIGEIKEEKNVKKTSDFLQKQIVEIFNRISPEKYSKIILAYEPMWAVGSGKVCENVKLKEIIEFIKTFISKTYHANVKVLYGGSVTEFNISKLNEIIDLDGYLVSSSALNPSSLSSIVSNCR